MKVGVFLFFFYFLHSGVLLTVVLSAIIRYNKYDPSQLTDQLLNGAVDIISIEGKVRHIALWDALFLWLYIFNQKYSEKTVIPCNIKIYLKCNLSLL